MLIQNMSVVAPRQTHERIFFPLRQRKIVLFTSNGNIIGYNKSGTEMLGTASKKGNSYDIQNNLV